MIYKARIILIAIGISAFLSFSVSADDICTGTDMDFIKRHAPVSDFSIISKKPVNGLCEVIISYREQLVPLYAGRDFIISGSLYRDKVKLTDDSINIIRTGIFKKHIDRIKEAVSFSYIPRVKNGKSVYMFTDPLCSYCNRAMKSVKELADKHGAVINFILLSFHGKEGKAKAVEAVCRKFTLDEYIRPEWKSSNDTGKYQCNEGKEAVSRVDKLSDLLGIDGVPAFYIDEGTFISGSEMKILDRALGKKK